MARVLGLDLSTHTGWCFFEAQSATPKFGTYRLPKTYLPEDYGTRCWALMQWLDVVMIPQYRPEIIALEAPFLPLGNEAKDPDPKKRFKTSAMALRLQISLAAIIETVAKKHKIRCLEIASSSAKVALAGSARLKEKKLEMVQAAWARGWEVADDHQADAIGVALVVYDSIE
jgi:Holliday junction resolvasome RuvABC endonuclease subunit